MTSTSPSPQTTTPTKSARLSATRLFGIVIPLVLVLAGFASISDVEASLSGPLGLIEEMPLQYFLVTGALVVSFTWHVRRRQLDTPVLLAHVFALIVLLHGAVSFIEQNPRFPVVYTHIGLTEYIQRTNESLPTLDARMNWPGFFSATAMLNNIAGVDSIFPFLLWAPLAFNFMYAPLLFTIARTASTDPRVPWVTLWAYYTLSWVGQDYFAPQALNFLFFLTFVAVVLRCFRTDRAALPRPIRRIGNSVSQITGRVVRVEKFQPGGSPILATTTAQRALLVGALAAIYAASVMSHQLTPVFLLLYITALVVLRKTVLRGFPLLMGVMFFSFVSYGAIGYWSGHMDDLFGGFGKLGGTVKDNVGDKVEVETNHVWVIYARLLVAASVWTITAVGLIRRLRSGRSDIAPLVGFVVPFFVLGGQSYGGEAILRVFLFSLPFAAVFVAFALLPTEKVAFGIRKSIVFALAGILLVPSYWLARFGNEAFEYVSRQNYEGSLALMRIAPEDSALVVLDGNTNNQIARMEQFAYITVPPTLKPQYSNEGILNAAAGVQAAHTFLYVDRAQVSNIQLTYGKPPTFFDDITRQVLENPRFKLIYENPDARIFTVDTTGIEFIPPDDPRQRPAVTGGNNTGPIADLNADTPPPPLPAVDAAPNNQEVVNP